MHFARENNAGKPSDLSLRRTKGLLVSLFGVIVFAFIGSGVWFYERQANILRADKSSELQSIALLKIDQLIKWRDERVDDVRLSTRSSFFSQSITQWITHPKDIQLEQEINTRLQEIIRSEEYTNAFIGDPNGKVLISLDSKLTILDEENLQLIHQVMADQQIHFGNLQRNPGNELIELNLAAPFINENQKPIAILVLQINVPKTIYPLIQSWPLPSASAETLLVRRIGNQVLYLSPLRFRPDPPLTLEIPISRTDIPSVQASLGKPGVIEGQDYRGEDVLAVIQPVPGTDWYLETKVDREEWYAGLNILMLIITGIIFLLILLTLFFFRNLFFIQEHNLYQKLLQYSQEKETAEDETRATLYSIGDGVITTDAQSCITRINPVAEGLTGWKESEVIGKPLNQVFNIVNEDTHQRMETPVERVLQEGRVVGLANHTILIDKNGIQHPIADSSAPIVNPKGEVIGVILVFRDQTAERAAQKERALLNFTISNSLNEIYIFDADTLRFRFVNQGALQNLGYSLEEMMLKTPLDIKPDYSMESFQRLLQPLKDHEQKLLGFETRHRRCDGSYYPVEVSLQLFEYEDQRVFLAVIDDISQRKQMEEKLKENQSRLIRAQAVAHVGNWEIDLKERRVWASEEAFRIYGRDLITDYLTVEDIQSFPLKEERPALNLALKNLIEKDEDYDLVFKIRRENDGAIRVIHSVAKLLYDREGKPTKVMGIIHDITETHQMEEKLSESEQRYRALFENNHTVMLLINPEDGLIVDANPAACTFYGWTHEQLLQMKIFQINTLSPEEIQQEMQATRENKHNHFYFKHRKADGQIRDVEVFTSSIQTNSITLLYSIVHDITDRIKAEKRIEQQMDELRRWYQLTLDRETRILELKKEVNQYLIQLNYPPKYGIEEEMNSDG